MDSDDLLLLLNGNPDSDDWRKALAWRHTTPPRPCSTRELPEAQVYFRDYIGRWIESGFLDDKSEVPRSRHYRTVGIQEIIQIVAPILSGSDSIRSFLSQDEEYGIQADRPSQKATKAIGVMSVWLNPSGGVEFEPYLYNEPLPPRELAALAFFVFWNNPQLLYGVMRCAYCGIYAFPLLLRGGEDGYKRGWLCETHRNTAPGAWKQKEIRDAYKDHWKGLAGQAYKQLTSRPMKGHTQQKLAQVIAEIVNKNVKEEFKRWSGYRPLQKNSVTRNIREIEAFARTKTGLQSSGFDEEQNTSA